MVLALRSGGAVVNKLMVWSYGAIAALAAVLAVVTWFAWEPVPPETPRAREYRNYDICLLTGEQGIATGPAKAAWEGLQTVSLETKVRLSYLTVTGEQTAARAQQFVASQVQQKCGIIVAVGAHQVAAVNEVKDKYPTVRFVVTGDQVDGAALASQIRPMIPKA